jgi:arsenate reductase
VSEKYIIYHNNRCSKSREGLCYLEDHKLDMEIVNYLIDTPTKEELKDLIQKLKIKPKDLVRTSEPLFKKKYHGKYLTPDRWIAAMVRNPVLIQRPIIVKGNKAVIARPPEKINELF